MIKSDVTKEPSSWTAIVSASLAAALLTVGCGKSDSPLPEADATTTTSPRASPAVFKSYFPSIDVANSETKEMLKAIFEYDTNTVVEQIAKGQTSLLVLAFPTSENIDRERALLEVINKKISESTELVLQVQYPNISELKLGGLVDDAVSTRKIVSSKESYAAVKGLTGDRDLAFKNSIVFILQVNNPAQDR